MAVDDGTVGDGGRTADFQAETVERACADRFAGACHDALRHFVRGRLGERQYENLFGGGTLGGKQPCDISDDGSGFAGSRARKHEGVVTCAGDRADLLVAQFVLFDCADCRARLLDSLGRQQRLRSELCGTALRGGPDGCGAGFGRWCRLSLVYCVDGWLMFRDWHACGAIRARMGGLRVRNNTLGLLHALLAEARCHTSGAGILRLLRLGSRA